MLTKINSLINVIDRSLQWATDFGKDTFPAEDFKEYRRKLRRFADSMGVNTSMAAYGESQVGKSYLMSSLLSGPDSPFVIENKGHAYSFIDELNPSGGNMAQTESTGVVTRFTMRGRNDIMKDAVKIRNLSVADLVMLIADAYYNDLRVDASRVLRYDVINDRLRDLQHLWEDTSVRQEYLSEDDVKDICDYIEQVIGAQAAAVAQSGFRKLVSEVIVHVKPEDWVKVFALLWNDNEELSRLFSILVNEYRKLEFRTEVYVPFDAVKRQYGTLLKIEWLDGIFGKGKLEPGEVDITAVYDADGKELEPAFSKSILSALIAELTFFLPKELAVERRFLEKIDLLDFPGARSREKFREQDIATVLPTILRRGKVAYLFNKYARALNISGILFCHHNNQKSEATLGDTINSWIEGNIGRTPAERTDFLQATNGISPLMFVATKFNIELQRTKLDTPENTAGLSEHWRRFKVVYPELLSPATWMDYWTERGGIFSTEAFQGIYLLRDYYWSGKNGVFTGYRDGKEKSAETGVVIHPDYPRYFDNLRDSFLDNDFVRKHFRNPQAAWESIGLPNRDGSLEIIRDLTAISSVIEDARRRRFLQEIDAMAKAIGSKLNVYYEPEDQEANNRRIRAIIRDIRINLDSNIGARPEIFGRIIDSLMIPTLRLRKIAYDIAVLHTIRPRDTSEVMMLRNMAGITETDTRDTALGKLCMYYCCVPDELAEELAKKKLTVEEVVATAGDIPSSMADLITKYIMEDWIAFINEQTKALSELLPHSDEIAFMLQSISMSLGVWRMITKKIAYYTETFEEEAQLPNPIADYASLTLNNFVSSVGEIYLTAEMKDAIDQKAAKVGVYMIKPAARAVSRPSLEDALNALDDAQANGGVADIQTLRKLPFWDNYTRWKTNLERGVLCVAEVSHVDPKANEAMKEILQTLKTCK